MKSGSLNFLEPPGPVQACNGTALLYVCVYIYLYTGVSQMEKYNWALIYKAFGWLSLVYI